MENAMENATAIDSAKVEKFVGKLVSDIGTAMQGALSYIGDKLGIFKAMADSKHYTVEELASKTGLSARYLKEWLGAMTTGEYVEYADGRYRLPPEHALPLADESFPFFVGGFIEMIVPTVTVAPKVAEAFKTGRGVRQEEYSPEMYEAIARGTMPWYKTQLVQNWLPKLPEVVAKLQAGGSAVDVGCGHGLAAITIAKAFPKARVVGFDQHRGSVEKARQNAADAGLGERVTFEVGDGTQMPSRAFDFVSTFDVVHDSIDPVGLLGSIRTALKPEGTYLMLEMHASHDVQENQNPIGRLLYSVSTLYCMTTSLAHGGAGIGACMGEKPARELAKRAGFGHFNKLPIDDPFSYLYELKA